MTKWKWIIGLTATLLLLALLAMPEENNEKLAAPLPSDVVAVAKGMVDVEGGIVHVAASRQGIVTDVLVEEGQRVTKGQVLARMDARQPQLSLDVINSELAQEQAELNKLLLELSQAKRDLQRMESLVASSSISQQRYDAAKDKFVNIEAETSLQKARLKKCLREREVQAYEVSQYTIRAPLDGLIVRRMAQPGQGTSTLDVTELFLILPDGKRIVRAEIEERFIDALYPGMPVTVAPQENEKRKRDGTIRRIGKIMGARKNATLNPTDRVDVRVIEVVIGYAPTDDEMIIGQRVVVRFRKTSQGDTNG